VGGVSDTPQTQPRQGSTAATQSQPCKWRTQKSPASFDTGLFVLTLNQAGYSPDCACQRLASL
ncbi:hypothetical protein, partial [Pseudomonas yamanorum]|uniref:hypothetical protein n=1 Tax=Pseudomonas yamanorum TaxID=515393 RepID=UPI003BA959EA